MNHTVYWQYTLIQPENYCCDKQNDSGVMRSTLQGSTKGSMCTLTQPAHPITRVSKNVLWPDTCKHYVQHNVRVLLSYIQSPQKQHWCQILLIHLLYISPFTAHNSVVQQLAKAAISLHHVSKSPCVLTKNNNGTITTMLCTKWLKKNYVLSFV